MSASPSPTSSPRYRLAIARDPLRAAMRFLGEQFVLGETIEAAEQTPLVAAEAVRTLREAGGQNAMIVDSSALLEQVVIAAIVSAFDSAGQRCSALRVLFLQDDITDRAITMLADAMAEPRGQCLREPQHGRRRGRRAAFRR